MMPAAAIRQRMAAQDGAWDDGFPLAPAMRPIAAFVIILSNLMVMLDNTITNVAVPHIAGNLGATFEQGTWTITSYAVAEAICVPLSGWLTHRYGVVRVFMVAVSGFTLFSLLCGMSVTLPMLVAFRVGQGLCGGPIMPLTQTAIMRTFPPAQLPKAFAIWTLTIMLGPAIGPVVGGFLSDQISWHWIFLINVPIGIACLVVGGLVLPPIETERVKLPIDKVGMLLLVAWIGGLQLLVDLGRDRDWFDSTLIVSLAIIAAVAFCAFVIWELTEEHPAVDLRLFGDFRFTTCVLITALCYAAYFTGIVTVPQWLQGTMGYSATASGVITGMATVSSMIAAQFALKILPRSDPRLMVTCGAVWVSGSFLLRGTWNTDADMFYLALTFALQGFGMPLMMMSLTNMTLSILTPENTPSGAGLNTFMRTMLMAVATALVLTNWSSTQVSARSGMVDSLNAGTAVADLGQAGMTGVAAASYMSGLVDRQAQTIAMLHTFHIAAAAVALCAMAVWLLPRIELTRLKGGESSAPKGDH